MQPSVNQIASMYRGNPGPLQQRVQKDQQTHQGIPSDLKELLALQILTDERDSVNRQQAIQQLQQTSQQPTVAQSLQQRAQQAIQARAVQEQQKQQGIQALAQQAGPQGIPEGVPQPQRQPQGIDHLPANVGEFAGGGIVAFATGNYVDEAGNYYAEPRSAEEMGNEDPFSALKKFAAWAGRNVERDPETGEVVRKTRVEEPKPVRREESRAPAPTEADMAAFDRATQEYMAQRASQQRQQAPAPRPAVAVRSAAQAPVQAQPAANVVNNFITPESRAAYQDQLNQAVMAKPEEREAARRTAYEQQVGAPETAGLESLLAEMQAKRARRQEENKNIDPLVEQLAAIANAPRGQKWMYSLLSGDAAVKSARTAREDQDMEMLKQIIEQQNKISDVKRGYKEQLFGIGDKERTRVYNDAFSAAKELRLSDQEAAKLAQDAVLKREQMASSERVARIQQSGSPSESKFVQDWLSKPENKGKTYSDAYAAYKTAGTASSAGKGQLTYDQASDNVDKYLGTPAGMMYLADLQKAAKKEGKVVNAMDVRTQMIRQAMTESGSTNAAKMPGAPSTAGGGQRTIDWNSIK